MSDRADQKRRGDPWDQGLGPGVGSLGEAIGEVLDSGKRSRGDVRDLLDDEKVPPGREYRARSPTGSERLNRAIRELSSAACKIHLLLWKWRGAPARGLLPFFTVHSLARFCSMSRPTVRLALRELFRKGWIHPEGYNKHHKNTLFRLVPIRRVPPPAAGRPDRRGRGAVAAEG